MHMAGLTKIEKKALSLFRGKVMVALPGQIEALNLFGSKARGEAIKHSDVDVLLVMKDTSWDNSMRVSSVVMDVLLETGVVLSVKKFTPEQIERMKQRRSMFWQAVEPDLMPL